jgi:hypothetical protein
MSRGTPIALVLTISLLAAAPAALGQTSSGQGGAAAGVPAPLSSPGAEPGTPQSPGGPPSGTTTPSQPDYAPGSYPTNTTAAILGTPPPVSGGAPAGTGRHRPGAETQPNPALSPPR